MEVTPTEMWWHAPKEMVHATIYETVRRLEMTQNEIFERMHRLEFLYDPNTPLLFADDEGRHGGVQENIIASNVDTITATIATDDIRVVFDTDGADWETQRRAVKLELYCEEQAT